MKLRSLPSQRSRKRYIVFRVHSTQPVPFANLKEAVTSSLLEWIGELGLAQAEFRFVKNLWDARKQTGFLQCNPQAVDRIKAGLALIHQIGDQRATFETLRVSGTIRSGKLKTRTGA